MAVVDDHGAVDENVWNRFGVLFRIFVGRGIRYGIGIENHHVAPVALAQQAAG